MCLPFTPYSNGVYYNLLPGKDSGNELFIRQIIEMLDENREPFFDMILDDDDSFTNPTHGEVVFYFFADVMYLEWLQHLETELVKWEKSAGIIEPKSIPGPIAQKNNYQDLEYFEQMFWEPADAKITIRVMNRLRLLEEDETFIAVKNNKKVLAILLDFLRKRENQKLRPVTDKEKARLLSERFKFSISERALRSLYKDSEVIMNEIKRLWQEESVKTAS